MGYLLLSSIFYKNGEQYDNIYQQRLNSESCYKLPVKLNEHDAFFIVTNEMCTKIESIYLKNMQLENICKRLPGVAMSKYILKNLVDEIMLTNDIEGIYSTRKEITDALNNKTSNKQARFKGIVKKYEKLISNDDLSLNNCEDIRKLYDDIALDEIDTNDLPDGAIFRKSEVSVYSATDKVKHKGIYPESSLIDFMNKSLEVLKDDNIPFLVRICIFHYLFGYAHPFYDGNGRVSRYISSYLLSNRLNILVALRISYTIKNNKSSYYKAFDDCNNKKNKGDITPFILMFLNVIENSLISLIEKLSEALEKLKFYRTIIKKDNCNSLNELQKNMLFILIQNVLFAEEGISIDELTKVLKKSDTLIRQQIKEIQDKGIPIIKGKSGKKLLYNIDLEQFEQLCM